MQPPVSPTDPANMTVPEIFNFLKYIIEIVIVPAGIWLGRTVVSKFDKIDERLDKVQEKQIEMKVVMTGTDGQNGLRGRMVNLEKKVDNMSSALTRSGVPVRGPREDL